jgi:hypothetical protein
VHEKPLWRKTSREVIEHCASIVESYADRFPEAAEEIASAIRRENRTYKATKTQVMDSLEMHPDWIAQQHADHLGCNVAYVHSVADRYNLKLGKASKERRSEAGRLAGLASGRARKAKNSSLG